MRAAQPRNRNRNRRRQRPTVTPRRPGALRKPAQALLTIPAEPLAARLPADPIRRAKRRHRPLAPMPRQNKTELLVHPTGLSPGHVPVLPETPLTCHPSIRSNPLPIYPVCTVSNPPLQCRPDPRSGGPETWSAIVRVVPGRRFISGVTVRRADRCRSHSLIFVFPFIFSCNPIINFIDLRRRAARGWT